MTSIYYTCIYQTPDSLYTRGIMSKDMLSKEQVLKIADLARLALTDDEVERYQQELSAILEYVEQLNELDTDQVEPTTQVTGLLNVVRDDVVDYEFTRVEMFKSAISTAEDHLQVSSVFKKKT